jgi:hypothetical protein
MLRGAAGGIASVVFGWGAVALIAGAPLGYFGAFGMTGSDYYNTCWEMSHAWGELTSNGTPQPNSSAQALSWPQCELLAKRAVQGEGIVHVESGSAIGASCHVFWKNIPLYVTTIDLVVADGGPGFIDRFLPAESLIAGAWSKRWPNCAKARQVTSTR